MTTDIHGKPLGLRMFLEGIEVPCIAVHIKIGMNGPAAADIEVVPTDKVMGLMPRTMVHVFYFDPESAPNARHENEQYRLLFMGEVISSNFIKTPQSRAAVLQCLDFSLYWDTAYQMMMDFGPQGNFFMGNASAFLGAKTNLFNSLGIGGDPTTVLSRLIQGQPQTPGLRDLPSGLLAGIIKIIESVGGVPSEFTGVNDFFTIGELRSRLLHQIGAAPSDRTPEYLLRRRAFNKFLRSELAGGGGLFSIRDIIKMMLRYIVHDVVPNPVAMYKGVSLNRVKENYTPLRDPRMLSTWKSIREALKLIKKAQQALRSTDSYMESIGRNPPQFEASNSALQTQSDNPRTKFKAYQNQRRSEHRINRGRQAILTPVTLALDARNFCYAAERELPTNAAAVVRKYLGQAEQILALNWDLFSAIGISSVIVSDGSTPVSVRSSSSRILFETNLNVSFDENFTPTKKTASQMATAVKDLDSRLKQVRGILQKARSALFSEARDVWEVEDARVPTQLFFPDIWFASPPVCNVVFPSDHLQLNFQRGMLREVSRLQLSSAMMLGGRVIRDRLLKTYYFAPAIEEFQRITKGCRWFMSSPTIMSHEIHTGIIPKLESISEVGRYVKRAQREITGRDTGSKINYIQRIANYNFFRHRYSARTVAFSGPKREKLVCGLPAAIIVQGVPNPKLIKEGEDSGGKTTLKTVPQTPVAAIEAIVNGGMRIENSPMNLMGKLVALGHSFTQQGGHTNGTLQFVRTHSDDDINMIQAMLGEQIQKAKTTGKKTYTLNVNTLVKNRDVKSLALLAAVTPQRKRDSQGQIESGAVPDKARLSVGSKDPLTGRKIISIRLQSRGQTKDGSAKLSSQRSLSRKPDGGGLIYFGGQLSDAPAGFPTMVDLDILEVAKNGTNDPWFWALLNSFDVATSATIIVETTTAVREDIVSTPFEERIRPYWMDTGTYHPKNIADEFYFPMLGCYPITDKLKIGLLVENATDDELAQLTEPMSVDQAVDVLSILYGAASVQPGAVDRFVHDYTDRPVASMVDILGDPWLTYDVDQDTGEFTVGSLLTGSFAESVNRGEYVRSAPGATQTPEMEGLSLEGFHSRSVSPILSDTGNLVGLLPGASVVRDRKLTKGRRDIRIPGRLDPRPEKRERVVAYVEQLAIGSTGIRSGAKGLEG